MRLLPWVQDVGGRLTWPSRSRSVLLAAWEVASRLAILSPRYFPPPTAVGSFLVHHFVGGDLGAETLTTVMRVAAAFAIAAIPGVAVGLLMGMARPVREAIDPYIAFLYPVPKIALLPFLLILLGVGEPAFVLTGALSAFFQIAISTLAGRADDGPAAPRGRPQLRGARHRGCSAR